MKIANNWIFPSRWSHQNGRSTGGDKIPLKCHRKRMIFICGFYGAALRNFDNFVECLSCLSNFCHFTPYLSSPRNSLATFMISEPSTRFAFFRFGVSFDALVKMSFNDQRSDDKSVSRNRAFQTRVCVQLSIALTFAHRKSRKVHRKWAWKEILTSYYYALIVGSSSLFGFVKHNVLME